LYRVDSSRNRHLGGSGLGLAICKQIVEAHGGTIAASRAGLGGLLMHIDLPLDNPDPG
jgi:two-component system sensor histidine kinase BaeS